MKLFKIKFSLSIFISFLIVSIIGFYSIDAIGNFYKYKKTINPNIKLTLDIFHFFIRDEIKKDFFNSFKSNVLSDKESPLKTFHITIKQLDLDSLNENLPESGKDHYVDGDMMVNNKTFKIKLRYRGDNLPHWFFTKKSLRIKLKNKKLFNMENIFNLVNYPNWFSIRDSVNYEIAKKIGLISPDYEPVRLFLNGKYMGVYMYLSQVNESLLRKYKRMPGSIYYGDDAPINENGQCKLWYEQQYWQKKASRNAEQNHIREDIALLIKAINNFNQNQFNDFVEKYLDKDKFFKFIALDRLLGSHHHDYTHNHKLYFDPYKGKFEPIEWDMRFWSNHPEKDIVSYPLLLRIIENPIYDAEIDKITFDLIKNGVYENIRSSYLKYRKMIYHDLSNDYLKKHAVLLPKLLGNMYSIAYDMDDFNKVILKDQDVLKKRKQIVIKYLEDARVMMMYKKTSIKGMYKIYFSVNGNSPVELSFPPLFTYEGESISKIIMYSGRKRVFGGQKKFPKIIAGNDIIVNIPKIYELDIFLKNDKNIEDIIVDISAKNIITNKNIFVTKKSFSIQEINKNINKNIKKKNIIHEIKLLQGTVKVDKTLIYNKFTNIIIEAGTNFIMDKNTSIYFYGKVIAIGTKEKPIKFIAKDPKKPWGLVAVQGKATKGSKFEYVEFENGSIDTHNLIHYTSPFNIHDTDWFEVRHCKIGRNFIGDDAMHIAYAKGIVDSCEFKDARSDGLDIDISNVIITNNIFYKSGNDGLDIMTTTMNASNNVFIDMGDKGISVGEWSDANITDSLFLRTVIGTEIKDKSKVQANNLIYVDTKEKAINLYNKNKRYDTGGFLNANNIYLLGNTKVKADKKSVFNITKKIKRLPKLKEFKWYKGIKNTSYKKFVEEMEIKYAQ